jgi:sugar-specific transcriptional regulator TrmB
MKNNLLKNAEERVESLSKIKETEEFVQLEELYKQGIIPVKKEDISASLKGKSNIYSHIKEILENSGKEVIICMSSTELESKSRIFSDTFDKLRKAGIKIRVALSGNEQEIKKAESRFKIKAEKINMDGKFFISDRKQVLFIVNRQEQDEEEVGIWLDSEFFANSLAYLFDLAVKK